MTKTTKDSTIKCDTCTSQYSRFDVETSQTFHSMDSYRFAFLRAFETLKSGFTVLTRLLACPHCRDEKIQTYENAQEKISRARSGINLTGEKHQ